MLRGLRPCCRAVRTRRFQSMSKQDIIQYVVIGLLTGMFWFQRGGKDTLAATQDTLGERFPKPAYTPPPCACIVLVCIY